MCSYVRVIKRSKWPDEEKIKAGIDINNLQARTIVQEMSMKGEESSLSIWKLNNEKDIALALVSTNKRNLEKITILKIEENLLTENGLNISQENGCSVVEELNTCHYDIINMNYKNLGDFAKVIIKSLENEENVKTISKKNLAIYINDAINSNKIDIASLDEQLVNEIKKLIR
ncbi:MAG: hypothetical protein IKG42_03340 [Clostridia bacterium]|nr:hypothetical protein [Clostridia bacterium]